MGDLVLGQAPQDATLDAMAGREGVRLRYIYDLGDYWTHTIVVERIGRPAPGTTYPRCLAGAPSGPP